MLLVLNMLGFWIYHSFKYVRVTQTSEYAWIIPGYVWLCLNVGKSVWMAFVLHLLIVIPYLKEPLTVFFGNKSLFFSNSSWKCLILFFVFISMIPNLHLPLGAEGPGCCESYPNSKIPNEYIYDAFLSILLLLFFHFLVLRHEDVWESTL